MIWINEKIEDGNKLFFRAMKPYLQIWQNEIESSINYITDFKDFDNNNQEIIKLCLFPLSDIKEGFIVNNFGELKSLSNVLEGISKEKTFLKKHPKISEYLDGKIDYSKLKLINMPISTFIEYYEKFRPENLDLIDLDSFFKAKYGK